MPAKLVNTMALATISADGKPSNRMVLLKEYSSFGFTFYTNYESQKGMEIAQNPAVSLLFWWETLERQIRIEGVAQKISAQQSDEYFYSRAKTSQIAAVVSQQSQPLKSGEELQTEFKKLCAEYADAEAIVPRPPHWGGYIVIPQRFEFWQGRENRLHDRFQYTRSESDSWQITRLFP
jgi:pyridoxamine 5'-phosphate oxidase